MTPNSRNQSTPPSTPYRWTSLFEVALGVLLVLGHNVFRVVPNEVFFLFALFWVSFKVRDGGWGSRDLSGRALGVEHGSWPWWASWFFRPDGEDTQMMSNIGCSP